MKQLLLFANQRIAACIVLLLIIAGAASAQKFPVQIADSVNKWSPAVTVKIQDARMQIATLDVFVKVKKFKGTTGECVVFFRNVGDKEISGWAALQIGSKADDQGIYTANATKISLKPGEEASKYLEIRECLPKGRKGMDAVGKCAACEPRICFADIFIN